jgi:uncharacterized protein (TIGR00369 family)
MDMLAMVREHLPSFSKTMGIEIESVAKDEVVGYLTVRDDLCTTGSILHGGAAMAFADTLGAVGTFVNLPKGAGTTTVESKTNFLRAAKAGTRLSGRSVPLHVGSRIMVWQTTLSREDGKPVAVITQSQMVL